MRVGHRPATARLRRIRKWAVSVGLGIVLGACVAAAVAASLVSQAPSWWRTTNPTDPATIRAGEEVENGVVNVIYEVRETPAAPWTVTLHAADANAWLNTRLGQWLANSDAEFEWPREVENLQVQFDDGLIQVGVQFNGGEREQILSATLRPEFRDDGSLWVAARSISVGRLPIPAGWIVERAGSIAEGVVPARVLEDPETARVLRALAGECPLDPDPVLELGDGRRVRVLRIAAERGRLLVQCRTEFEE
ncbi:MAG TPA: hypothetical protein VFF69_15220 [Phycisphaerales bacterium]|nr:hypothetical protein [Phycisphaerales bacterium]